MYGKAAACKSISAVSRRSSSTDLGPATFIDAKASVAGTTCTRQLSPEPWSQDSIHWPTAAAPDEVVVMKYSSEAIRAVTPSSSTTPSSPHIRPYWAEPAASADQSLTYRRLSSLTVSGPCRRYLPNGVMSMIPTLVRVLVTSAAGFP